jgi:hypothetical protein
MQNSKFKKTPCLPRSDWTGPVNIGWTRMVTINQLADMAMAMAGKMLNELWKPNGRS